MYKLKAKSYKLNRGMTYVELIVVLSIFSVMTSIVLFNYDAFEENINIKILANNIAIKIVDAQKSAVSGKLPPSDGQILLIDQTWKPSYGVYFDSSASNNKAFTYFTDLPTQNSEYDSSLCNGQGECIENISINKGNYVSKIESCATDCLGGNATLITTPLSITFKRPNSGAIFYSNGSQLSGFDYIQISISSASSMGSKIRIYPSGRIEIK